MVKRTVMVVAVMVFCLVIALLLTGGVYQLTGTGNEGVVYRLNRITGKTWVCAMGKCQSLKELPTPIETAQPAGAEKPEKKPDLDDILFGPHSSTSPGPCDDAGVFGPPKKC